MLLHVIEQAVNMVVARRVEGVAAVAADRNQPRRAQFAQLMAHGTLLKSKLFAQLADGVLAVFERQQDLEARGVCQYLEHPCCLPYQFLVHAHPPKMKIHSYECTIIILGCCAAVKL